jgi:hypothetical protein
METVQDTRWPLEPRSALPRLALAFVALLLMTVWLRVHSWESYMYAASAEGFFRMSEMFSAVYGGAPLPEISRYHPYHPLFHMLVENLWRAASTIARVLGGSGTLSALSIAVVLNKASALAAAVLAFRILCRLLGDPWSAGLSVGGLFFTKAFLFGAFSGDAHMASLALFLGSLELVLRPTDTGVCEDHRAVLAATLFSLGAGMNLAIFFYGLLPLAVLLAGRRLRAAGIAMGLSAVILFCIYVVTPVLLFDLEDLAAYSRLFGIYSYMPTPDGSPLVLLYEFVDAVSAGLVGGIDGLSAAARVLAGLLLLGGAICLWRAPRTATPAFWVPMWIGGFAVGELAMHTVKSVNGTVYVMLPLYALVGFLLRALKGRRALFVLVVAALASVAALNVSKVVVTKAWPAEEGAPRLLALRNPPSPDTPVAVLLTHMALFQEVYHLGHDLGFKTLKAFIPTVPQSRAELEEWTAEQRLYCELSASPEVRTGSRTLLRASSTLSPDLYHFSVNHPWSKGFIVKHVSFACGRSPRAPTE